MESTKYEVKLANTRVDALKGKSIFEYKARVTDVRVVQSALINLARIINDLTDHIGILILDEAKISKSRLNYEWVNLSNLLKSSIFSRLRLVIISDGSIVENFGELSPEQLDALFEIREKLNKEFNPRKPDAFFEILRILLVYWFRRGGSLQMNQLAQISGFTYPTVAASLEKIESKLIRNSDRSVELKSFPRDDWFKLIAVNDDIRTPRGFQAHRPRPVEALIERLNELSNEDIAFGGIIGARHYLPGIDLIGIPRLDLNVHNWSAGKIDKFVQRLDPGLKRVESNDIPQVVVHNLRRPESLFIKVDNLLIADEVECLLDLHETHLESQALELLDHLKGKARQ